MPNGVDEPDSGNAQPFVPVPPESKTHAAVLAAASASEEALARNEGFLQSLEERIDKMGRGISTAIQDTELRAIEREGALLGAMCTLERKMDLAVALGQSAVYRLSHTERETRRNDDKLVKLDNRVEQLTKIVMDSTRVSQLDPQEIAERARLKVEVEHLKEDMRDVTDTQKARSMSGDSAVTTLLTEVVKTTLVQRTDEKREERADTRAEKTHEREETSKLKWWVLGLAAAISLSAVSALAARWTGKPVPVEVPSAAASGHH